MVKINCLYGQMKSYEYQYDFRYDQVLLGVYLSQRWIVEFSQKNPVAGAF